MISLRSFSGTKQAPLLSHSPKFLPRSHPIPLMASLLFTLSLLLLLPTLCLSQDSGADSLIKLKNSLQNGDSKLNNWVQDSSPCAGKWVGVMCAGETIIGLHLTNLGLSGSFDVSALVQLRSLRTISLVKNKFEGSISEFNKLGQLRAIYLSNNQFSGEIPNGYFGSMGSLKKVWLNGNNFTGKIPDSLMQLSHLTELNLEGNQFSGKIPASKYPDVLKKLDLKGNKLEGAIPESLSKFNASAFEGNDGLCGKPLEKQCFQADLNKIQKAEEKQKSRLHSNATVAITILTLLILAFFVIVAIVATNSDDDDKGIGNGSSSWEPLRELSVGESTLKSIGSTSRMSTSSGKMMRGSSGKNGNMNDLVMVNPEKGCFGLANLMKAAAEVLGSGAMGSAYKAAMSNGLVVVVKRMREMNRLGKDGFEAELKRFGKFKHPNVLTPLAFHFRREEKLIVSEYMPCGSLLYALHGDRGVFHAKLNWANRLKIIKGIARGLDYIHKELSTYEVPHGNLKSSNILLTENYDPLLSDYGFQPLINSDSVVQALFGFKSPEFLQNQKVSPKLDVYCLGIVILEIMTGKFPSQYLNNSNGGIDIVQWVQSSISENKVEELIDPQILSSSPDSMDQIMQIIRIGAACTENNPDQRLTMIEATNKIQEVN